jgi:hypothetical protein
MTFGNRLYLGGSHAPPFQQTALNEAIAQSDWAWGGAAFDFDNDGLPDLYIANGHESKQSVRDYDSEFWLHDIYVGTSSNSVVANAYFVNKSRQLRGSVQKGGRGFSYGGYDKNRLYWNRRGRSFEEIGYLMGVSLEQDSRNVVADDLNGDGKVDLVVTTFEVWPKIQQTIRVFENELPDPGNWIGFRLGSSPGGPSPVGARIVLRRPDGSTTAQFITGDSYRSERAPTLHFGLGQSDHVIAAEIRWPNRHTSTRQAPAVNRYHSVRAPVEKAETR